MGQTELFATLFGSLLLAPLWYGLEYVLQFMAVPISQANNLEPKMHNNVRNWISKGGSHVFQLSLWIVYALGGETWILHPWSYHETLDCMNEEAIANRSRVVPLYIFYLGYAWHSLVTDLKRSKGKLYNPMQIMFLFHHVLTIFLVALSLDSNNYRSGVLTRLALEPSDIGVYLSKISTPVYEAGNLDFSVVAGLYVGNIAIWIAARVMFYGFFNWSLTVMYLRERYVWEYYSSWSCLLLLVGMWMMWALQAIWAVSMGCTVVKFLRSGRVIADGIDRGQDEAVMRKHESNTDEQTEVFKKALDAVTQNTDTLMQEERLASQDVHKRAAWKGEEPRC